MAATIDDSLCEAMVLKSVEKCPTMYTRKVRTAERAGLDTDEDRDEHAEEAHEAQAEIDDDLLLALDRELADEQGRADHEKREEDQVVQHAVTDRLPERVPCDECELHSGLPRRGACPL